jgi:hypothetical protein
MSAEYRDQMEGPMENLACTLILCDKRFDTDAEIVEVAARQFSVVYKLLLATGKYTEAELDIILNPGA